MRSGITVSSTTDVFGSLIAFSAYRFVVERVSPTLASTYAYVNPPVALFVGWWLPIVLSAVALHAWVQARERSEPPQIPVRVPMIQADAVRQNP